MKIEYYLELDDLVQFNRFHAKHSSVVRRVYLCLYFIPIIAMLIQYAQDSHWPWAARVTGFFFYSTLWILNCLFWKWFFSTVIIKRMIKEGRNRTALGRHEVILEENKVVELTSANEMHTAWSGVERVVENDKYIYIYLSSSSAHVIPKRAFAGQEDARAFFETAREYHGRELGLPQYCGAPVGTFSR